jgi:hypothetical protein
LVSPDRDPNKDIALPFNLPRSYTRARPAAAAAPTIAAVEEEEELTQISQLKTRTIKTHTTPIK